MTAIKVGDGSTTMYTLAAYLKRLVQLQIEVLSTFKTDGYAAAANIHLPRSPNLRECAILGSPICKGCKLLPADRGPDGPQRYLKIAYIHGPYALRRHTTHSRAKVPAVTCNPQQCDSL